MLSKKVSYGNKGAFKYFIGYRGNAGIIPLFIILPQMNAYAKYFRDSKCIKLLDHDEEILKKYNEMWNKAKSLFEKEFNSEPVYNNKYIKTKISLNTFLYDDDDDNNNDDNNNNINNNNNNNNNNNKCLFICNIFRLYY